jgi:hypothetical protein
MHITKLTLTILTALSVASCASPEQRAENERKRQMRALEEQKQYIEMLSVRCDAYGYTRNTTAFAQCIQQGDEFEAMKDAARKQNSDRLMQQGMNILKNGL